MKCLLVGEKPGVVDGGWSNWSPWSRCSRTCGSGVTLSVRRCVNPVPSNGGAFCRGDRKRHKICATEVSSAPLPTNLAKNLARNWIKQKSVRYFVSWENETKDESLVMDGYRAVIDFWIDRRMERWKWIIVITIARRKIGKIGGVESWVIESISCEIIWNSKNGWLKGIINVVILGGRIIYERFDDNFIRATKFRGEYWVINFSEIFRPSFCFKSFV